MCGFTVTREAIPNLLKHRGIFEMNHSTPKWEVNFNSLPLSSGTGKIYQPLVHHSGRVLIFNGEIFNYKTLDSQADSDLEYLANIFGTLSPIELYAGSSKWDGFWAIAIIEPNQDLYWFTDWIGKKQLYYDELVGIASEIKPLLVRPYHYVPHLGGEFFGTSTTPFSNTWRSLPGALYKNFRKVLEISGGEFHRWNLYDTIHEAVEERMENKLDGVSLLLSSGLDSNILLHHMLKITQNIEIISFEGPEFENVQRICELNKLQAKFIKQEDADLETAVRAYEYPLDYGSLLPNYQLFKACSNYVVMTGDGADEFFSGYNRSKAADTFYFDVYRELPYYHNIRIDRMSMIHTKEARSPLMSYKVLNAAKRIPLNERTGKQCLRELYKDVLPDFVINGNKTPLRTSHSKEENIQKTKLIHQQIFKS